MIYVVRHGQTNMNKEKRLQGRNGLPLNENGIEQAYSIKAKLQDIQFDFAYSSPQLRAIDTAKIISGLHVITDPRLDVFDLGDADGLPIKNVKFKGSIPDPDQYHGVERIDSFVKRVFDFMHELKQRYAGANINVLIAGHRCTTGCIGSYFMGIPQNGNMLQHSSSNGEYKIFEFPV